MFFIGMLGASQPARSNALQTSRSEACCLVRLSGSRSEKAMVERSARIFLGLYSWSPSTIDGAPTKPQWNQWNKWNQFLYDLKIRFLSHSRSVSRVDRNLVKPQRPNSWSKDKRPGAVTLPRVGWALGALLDPSLLGTVSSPRHSNSCNSTRVDSYAKGFAHTHIHK